MSLGTPRRPAEPLRVLAMAAALAFAAFAGGALGLVWQSVGLGSDQADRATKADKPPQSE
jgi:ferric-dicitrate binding protein FerR (iron transport regulator)